MNKSLTASLNDIPKLAKDLARQLKGGEVLALTGPLGSGKTTFAKALGRELKVKNTITSPTFTLMQVYQARLAGKKSAYFYHLDLYRTKNFHEVKALGITEIWQNKDVITVIEWADKIKNRLPKNTIKIKFINNPVLDRIS